MSRDPHVIRVGGEWVVLNQSEQQPVRVKPLRHRLVAVYYDKKGRVIDRG